MNLRRVNILLVEDDDVDAEAVLRSFQRNELPVAITVVPDGIEALKLLRGRQPYRRLARPYVILLDINLPRMNGLEFLRELRQDPELCQSIVFVLTTSASHEDISEAYNYQVAGYLTKTGAGPDFGRLIHLMDGYVGSVTFPPERRKWTTPE